MKPTDSVRPLFFLFFSLMAYGLFAQIAPPEFICTRSEGGEEVLRWNNVVNNCGAYEATEIYVATSRSGPFTLLAEINDPTATEFRDPNPAAELRFYFLRYRYDCPGETVGTSETLDSAIPRTPVIQYVSVEDGDILLNWQPSESPEVTGYIIFEVTATAFVPLDTVYGVTEYRFAPQTTTAETAARSFRLVAIDPCGNDSPQGTIVSPLGLSGSGGMGCEDAITLTAEVADLMSYLPTVALELFVSVNGGPYTFVGSVAPNAAELRYNGANDGEDLCFYVEAVLANGSGRARSTEYCQRVAFNQPVRDFPLYGAELDPDGSLLLRFADDRVQPANVTTQLLVTDAGGRATLFDVLAPLFGGGGSLSLAIPYPEGASLRLRVADDCGREVTTNAVVPFTLEARALFPGQNLLNWTRFRNDLPGEIRYDLERATVADVGAAAGAMFGLTAMDLSGNTFSDDAGDLRGIVCYRALAKYRPDVTGPARDLVFRSNVSCVLPVTEVFIPNAFSPTGQREENRIFRPLFSNLPAAEGYLFRVLDRWGGVLFESQDPTAGWAGDARGQLLPSGAYLYQLEYRSSDGFPRQRAGVINLLR